MNSECINLPFYIYISLFAHFINLYSTRLGDGLVMLLVAGALAYIFQAFIEKTSSSVNQVTSAPTRRISDDKFSLALNCLNMESEADFDQCVKRLGNIL